MSIAILIVTALVLVWLLLTPDWMPTPPEYLKTNQVTTRANKWVGESNHWVKQQTQKFKQRQTLGQQLSAWANNEDLLTAGGFSDDQKEVLAQFKLFIQALGPTQLEQLAKELNAFCKHENVELSWLLVEDHTGEMQKTMAAMVMFFGLAARQRQSSIPSARLRVWQENPQERSNRAFGNLLYVRLVKDGVLTVPAELLMAPAKDRMEHQVRELMALVKNDRERLLPIVEELIAESDKNTATKDWRNWLYRKAPQATAAENS